MAACRTESLGYSLATSSIDDGTLCRAASPLPGPAGAPASYAAGVGAWSVERKLFEAARRAGPMLPEGMRQEFAGLFTAENLGMTAAIFGALAISHACGVGEIADIAMLGLGVAMLGRAAFGVAGDVYHFGRVATAASSEADLDRAAGFLAHAISVVGVTAVVALVAKAGKRLSGRMKANAASGEGGAVTAETAAVDKPIYEMIMEADGPDKGSGTMAQAMRRAALDDYLRNKPQLNQGGSVPQVEWAFDEKTQSSYVKNVRRKPIRKIRQEHISGTDLSRPVTMRQVMPDAELVQYVRVGGQVGMYAAEPGTSPATIGINGARVLARFRVNSPFRLVQSTAATINGRAGSGVGGRGGGLQYILPPDWDRYVTRLTGNY